MKKNISGIKPVALSDKQVGALVPTVAAGVGMVLVLLLLINVPFIYQFIWEAGVGTAKIGVCLFGLFLVSIGVVCVIMLLSVIEKHKEELKKLDDEQLEARLKLDLGDQENKLIEEIIAKRNIDKAKK